MTEVSGLDGCMPDLTQATYFVAFFTTAFSSMEDIRREAPDALQRHLERTRRLHSEGAVLMAGAFLEPKGRADLDHGRPGQPRGLDRNQSRSSRQHDVARWYVRNALLKYSGSG